MRNYNFISDDSNSDEEVFGDFVPDWEDDQENNEPQDDDNCPYLDLITTLLLQDKPLGIMWTLDKMLLFLKARGYKLLERKDSSGNEYMVAVNPSDSSIPDTGRSNIKEVFDSEMQEILLKWVLKIASEL